MKTGTLRKSGSLASRTALVAVTISQWSGRKVDKKATETANVTHKADAAAGQYHKKLLPAAVELEKIGTIASQARKFYYDQTLPWMSDGTRIISSKNIIPFQREMKKIVSQFDQAVREFEAAYPQLQKQAASRLGELYSEEEYPDNIAEKFAITVDYLPMPESGDFRIDIGEGYKKTFERKMKEIEGAAMRDAAQRLLAVIKTATEKLKDPKAIFRDSMLENIKEVAALIPNLNISDDKILDDLSQEAIALVDSVDLKEIRTDSKSRDAARKALSEVEAKMGAFMVFKHR